jgi:hypothetical protein
MAPCPEIAPVLVRFYPLFTSSSHRSLCLEKP